MKDELMSWERTPWAIITVSVLSKPLAWAYTMPPSQMMYSTFEAQVEYTSRLLAKDGARDKGVMIIMNMTDRLREGGIGDMSLVQSSRMLLFAPVKLFLVR